MPSWRNMPSMPKVRASSGMIGTTCLPMSLSRTSAVSARTNAIVVEISRPSPEPFSSASKADSGGTGNRVGLAAPLRQEAAKGLAPLEQIFHLRSVGRRNVERQLLELLVRDGNVELVAHLLDGGDVDFLQLVRRILRLPLLAQAVALDGLGEDHRRLALVLDGRGVRGVHLVRVVAAAIQSPDVLVRQLGDHLERFRVLAEEMLAHERTVVRLVVLVFAVERFLHDAQKDAVLVPGEQRVPVRAPDHLDHVPARAAEFALELLDALAVAAHRSVEPLQVAVDDEY